MIGPLAQLVALASYGNACLRGKAIGAFFPENSTFQFCNTVDFLSLNPTKTGFTEELLADSPLKWLDFLKSKNCVRLKLAHIPTPNPQTPDHKLAGFIGGGGRWLIESVYKIDSDFWEARWQGNNPKAAGKKVWRVSYGALARNTKRTADRAQDLAVIRRQLEQILDLICEFARKHKLDNFAAFFQSGLDCLAGSQTLEKIYHKDLVPVGWYSTEAEQILTAVSAAWVFGGMGSWNDLGFEGEDNKLYENLSAQLYRQINESIVAAVNSKP
jgi:hypothetical protein